MRIVALGDQHGYLPDVPACDLVIIAGDVCPDLFDPSSAKPDAAGQKAWFDDHARPWLAAAPAAHRILTWGNHDWCGQAFPFVDDSPPNASTTALQILVDDGTTVPAQRADGRHLSVWGSPWSIQFMDWAFMKPPAELAAVYAAIPAGVDILVTHQPPRGYGDRHYDERSGEIEHLGSQELLTAIDRIRPRLVICGHLHGGYGRFQHDGTTIYNVSVVNEHYRLVRPPTVIDIADW